ncbi:helix-turn-helix domain-containing protein [Streptomyces sp. LN500]|uniref:helix-turn-helix domain-containing protein n=1 Tax=Streptomyces sp. LN500 TaxID=3112978 RepID=UPI0037199AF1
MPVSLSKRPIGSIYERPGARRKISGPTAPQAPHHPGRSTRWPPTLPPGTGRPTDRAAPTPRTQVPPRVRARVIALTRMSPPVDSGLSHWSTRTLAGHLKRREGISVSWHYIARVWREESLKPHRSGTFKISKDPAFAEKGEALSPAQELQPRWFRTA